MKQVAVELEAFKDAVRQYRIIITGAAVGEPTPVSPANPAFALPEVVPTGIFQRLIELVDRIRAAPAYTDEIGALIGIIPSATADPTPVNELKPVFKASESFGGFKFDVNVTRLKYEAFKIQIQRFGSEVWSDAAFATKNRAKLSSPQPPPANPKAY